MSAAWEWVKTYPHPAAAVLALISGALLWLGRFAFTRHREFVAFVAHMDREEKQVWPSLAKQLADNHHEAMTLLSEHGERISALEAKMPNGEIHAIVAMVSDLWERRNDRREGSA